MMPSTDAGPREKEDERSVSAKGSRGADPSMKDMLLALLLGLAALLYTGLYFDRGLDSFDAGLFAAEAERALSGGIYGKDFLAPYGPGRYYVIGVLFWIFGPSLKVQAAFWLVLRGAAAFLMYRVARRLLPAAWAILPVLAVTAAHGALHKSLFQVTALLNILAYLSYRRSPSWRSCFAAGLVIAAGSLFRADVGVFGFLSFLILLGLERLWNRPPPAVTVILKRTVVFAAGAAVLLAPVFLYLLLKSDIGLILKAEWHRTRLVSAFPEMLQFPNAWVACMVYGAPIVYAMLIIAAVLRRVRLGPEGWGLEVLALAVFGVPLLNQVRITPTFNHWLHAAPLVFLSVACLAWMLKASRPASRIPSGILRESAGFTVILLACGLPVYYNLACTKGIFPGSLKNRFEFTELVKLERAGIYETPERARNIEKLVRRIRETTRPEEPLFAGPFSPAINFLADRPPATRYLEPFYYFRSESLQKLVVADLFRTRPLFVIFEFKDDDPAVQKILQVGGMDLKKDGFRVYEFIRLHYDRVGMWGRFEVWLRRERK